MFSIISQCSLLRSYPSQVAAAHDDQVQPITKSANFGRIPSWVSLNCTPSSQKTRQTQPGKVENMHLVSLSNQGKLKEAVEFLKRMDEAGVPVRPHSYKCLFEMCGKMGALSDGKSIYDWLRSTAKDPPEFLRNYVLRMLCDCGSLFDAQTLFDEMLEKNLVSWNIMISAYAEKGQLDKAVQFFCNLQESGIKPDPSTFTSLLSLACSNMDDGETKRSTGYGKPPWMFKGSALYQLHLVRAETARACIPKEFRLVEAFGYTLGGFFLASYDDSPAGVFDEVSEVCFQFLLILENMSTGWATKVLVNSDEACDHGRKEVGLPSQVARFSKRITAIPRKEKSEHIGFLDMIGMSDSFSDSKDHMDVQVTEVNGPAAEDDSSISLTTLVPALKYDKWMGPTIKLSLPSFSGRTEYTPEILKVRAVQPAKVSSSDPMPKNDKEHSELHSCCTRKFADSGRNLSTAIMLSKPILALKFSCMTMQVEAPSIVSDCSKKSLRTC
ncbi:hypothetical protein FEM48_Zijuj10G0173400 [Ziziphus jujuba var. spinosa]|uniref:Pentatricopeptide repeat-containing protein n=1 Tax=Ziziphus jujuba var. spinosa TaxID=714518 RepID=A0A978UPQ0_ZIZJJ|nr:hypothetical protein FEM48_Zijuj10G0173400 [Ziziphus jujuba var. spinosa]